MAKPKSIYACTECGASAPKWQGQCPGCGVWNTLVETIAETSTANQNNRFAALAGSSRLQQLSEIQPRLEPRTATGIEEFDRVLGGGLVAGGVVLIGGDPGIGNPLRELLYKVKQTLRRVYLPLWHTQIGLILNVRKCIKRNQPF